MCFIWKTIHVGQRKKSDLLKWCGTRRYTTDINNRRVFRYPSAGPRTDNKLRPRQILQFSARISHADSRYMLLLKSLLHLLEFCLFLHPKPKINHPENCSDLAGESTIQAVLPTEEDQTPLLHPGEMVHQIYVYQRSKGKKIFHICNTWNDSLQVEESHKRLLDLWQTQNKNERQAPNIQSNEIADQEDEDR